MTEIIRTIIVMSLSGGTITLLLFAIKPLIRDRLTKTAQYYLWLTALAAFIIPVPEFISIPIQAEAPAIIAPISYAAEQYILSPEDIRDEYALETRGTPYTYLTLAEKVSVLRDTGASEELINILSTAYSIIALLIISLTVMCYLMFVYTLDEHNKPAHDEMSDLSRLASGGCIPKLYRNNFAPTPMLVGLFLPAIILPDKEYSPEALHAVIRHELAHLKKHDILFKWIASLACALHWFNPLVWLLRLELSRACELACDEYVIKDLDTAGKQAYGDTLITVTAECRASFISVAMCEDKKSLKERLRAIMLHKKSTRLIISISKLAVITAICTVVVLGTGTTIVHNYMAPEPPFIAAEYTDTVYTDSFVNIAGTAVYNINAKITGYPEGSSVPVIRITPHEITVSEAKQVAKAIFGDAEIHAFEPDYLKSIGHHEDEGYISPEEYYIDNAPKIPIDWMWEYETISVMSDFRDERFMSILLDMPSYTDYEFREIDATALVDGIHYRYLVSSRKTEDPYTHRNDFYTEIFCYQDPEYRERLLKRGGALPTDAEIAEAEDTVRTMLDHIGLSHWVIDSSSVMLPMGGGGAHMLTVHASPTYNGIPVTRQTLSAFSGGECFEGLQVSFIGGRLYHFNYISPMDTVRILYNNANTLPFDEIISSFKKQMLPLAPTQLQRYVRESAELAEVIVDKIEFGLSRTRVPDSDDLYLVPSVVFSGQIKTYDGSGEVLSDTSENDQFYKNVLLTLNAVDGSVLDVATSIP